MNERKESRPGPDTGRKRVSVILLTKNAETGLPTLLDSLQEQETVLPAEILILDSDSRDRTPEIAHNRGISFHRILPEDFSHSRTRNFGVSLAKSDYIVFITQDAAPENRFWLAELIKPFGDCANLAATYSRQIPKTGCNPPEKRSIGIGAPEQDELRKIHNSADKNGRIDLWRLIRFSNVSACYRTDLLRQYPFDERLSMVEDQEWCRRILEQGFKIRYCAKSVVRHSHHFGIRQCYRRAFEYGVSYRKFMRDLPPKKLSFIRSALWESLQDALYILRDSLPLSGKISWMAKSPLWRFSESYGFYRGWHHG
ncbi:MAG TPA: glycosyltransferase [Candidatus Omnitrophota bacterium]|nr:glycosyltransferase [Candidatus Omnitrophota bacterium]